MNASSPETSRPQPSPVAGYAFVDSELRVREASPGFWSLVGKRLPGLRLVEALPVFGGAEETLRAVALSAMPHWHLHAVAHHQPGADAPAYFDVDVQSYAQPSGLLVTLTDVTAEMTTAQSEMHQRNAARLAWALNGKPKTFDLETENMLAICERLGLMMALLDEQLMISAATPNFVDYRRRSLAGWPVAEIFPPLAGLEDELRCIALNVAPAWRLQGLLLDEDHLRPCDLLIMPHPSQTGLILAARQMEAEALAEQALRQQRNELTLLQEQMEKQALELRRAHDRLGSLDRERRALLDLIVFDIRSALTLVEGYAEWLVTAGDSAPAAQQAGSLDAIRKNARKVHTLIKDVESIQHIEGALADMHWESIDLAALMEQTAGMWRDLARLRGVRLDLIVETGLAPILGDSALLQEALGVLMDLALARARGDVLPVRVYSWEHWAIIRFGLEGRPMEAGGSVSRLRQYRPTDEDRSAEFRLARARLIAEGHGGRLAAEDMQTHAGADAGAKDAPAGVFSLWLLAKDESTPARYHLLSEKSPKPVVATEPSLPPGSDLLVAGEGSIRINTKLQRVWVNDELLTLSTNEYRLLVYLAEHADQVVLHEQLRSALWALDEQISLDTLRVLIWRLRQKLQHPTRRDVQYLRTVRGFGYVLVS